MNDRVEQGSPAINRRRERHLLRLKLSGWGRLGEALAEHDGKKVFVFGGISGEDVIVEVIKKERRYITSRVVEVLTPSPHRVNSPCKYFGQCTGCQWQHIEYSFQLSLKKEMVIDSLQRVGKINNPRVSDPISSPLEYGYRNHARFTVSPQGYLGFVNRQNNKLVPVDQCLIMHDGINRALNVLNGGCAETTQLSIRYGANTGDMLIQPQLKNSELSITSGQKHYSEKLKEKVFCIDSPSFFQVNTLQAEKIVDVITGMLSPKGTELLVDLYGGVGTFAILLAPLVRRVVGIEESLPAIENARQNSEGVSGIEFVQGKAEVVMTALGEVPDFVILDPPRKGCSQKVLDALVELAPLKIIYVSCDPNTMARDLKILCGGPFKIDEIQPVDLFPQTHHLECITSLVFKGHDGPVILASASPRRKRIMECVDPSVTIIHSSFVENAYQDEEPEVLTKRLALGKATNVASEVSEGLILGADTVVVYQGNVLGKPVDDEQAVSMLKNLRGQVHHVVTGIAMVDARSGNVRTACKTSTVIMREYNDKEIEDYVQSGKSIDKAGGYGIQDKTFINSSVIGCYANVVGLPLCSVSNILAWFGVKRDFQRCVNTLEQCQLCSKIKEGHWTYLG